jgi:hypothetical protein
MSQIHSSLQVKGLNKQKLAAMYERAKLLGMTPQRYLKHLVEEDLAVSERAKSSTFQELLGPGSVEDEAEIDRLVEESRTRFHRRNSRKA